MRTSLLRAVSDTTHVRDRPCRSAGLVSGGDGSAPAAGRDRGRQDQKSPLGKRCSAEGSGPEIRAAQLQGGREYRFCRRDWKKRRCRAGIGPEPSKVIIGPTRARASWEDCLQGPSALRHFSWMRGIGRLGYFIRAAGRHGRQTSGRTKAIRAGSFGRRGSGNKRGFATLGVPTPRIEK